MAKLNNTYNFGDRRNIDLEELIKIVEDMYRDIADEVNKKPDVYVGTSDGDTASTFVSIGDININTSSNKVEVCTNHAGSSVTWTTVS